MAEQSASVEAHPSRSTSLPLRRLGSVLLTVLLGLSISMGAAGPNGALEKAAIPAFPNAEAAGAFTRGGRCRRVFEVTHLGDGGPGEYEFCSLCASADQ